MAGGPGTGGSPCFSFDPGWAPPRARLAHPRRAPPVLAGGAGRPHRGRALSLPALYAGESGGGAEGAEGGAFLKCGERTGSEAGTVSRRKSS